MVEDNRADVYLIREAIESAGMQAELHIMPDGEKAVQFFKEMDGDDSLACPGLVILDINLPRRPGREVLEEMRRTRRCARIPVLVVTSSDSQRDRDEMRILGADMYFRKPSDYLEFMKLGEIVKGFFEEKRPQ